MRRKLLVVLSVMILLPAVLLAAGSGKIRGKVTDRETGEPLIGANVVIEGTSLGASTDVNGEYYVLSVPVGTYTVRATYVGYRSFTMRNVEVNADLTKEVNLQLSSESVQVPTVEVVAERPLINKNATNAVTITRAEDIQNMPVRTVDNVVSLQTGVVNQGGTIYIRGGRSDEVAFYIEGVGTKDPLFGGNTSRPIISAVEEIQLQAGGYTAEYGGANAGMIVTAMKTGSSDYHISAEGISDAIGAKPGQKYLGGYSYGYSDYTLTLSGPLPSVPQLRFFVAGEHEFNRSGAQHWSGVNIPGLIDPSLKSSVLTKWQEGTFNDAQRDSALQYYTVNWNYRPGNLLNNASSQYYVNGSITADLSPLTLKLGGTYQNVQNHGGVGLFNFADEIRAQLYKQQNITASLKATHLIDKATFYDISLNYFDNKQKWMDPFLQDNFMLYGDSVANAAYGFTLKALGEPPPVIVLYDWTFNRYGAVLSGYQLHRQSSIGGKLNFVHQIGTTHEIKAGGELTYYTIRRFAPFRTFGIAKFAHDNSGYSQYNIMKGVGLDNYGYDFDGTEGGTGLYAPHHPIFAAAYAQDKIEYEDLVMNLGLRLDYINVDNKVPRDPTNINLISGLVAESDLVKVPARTYVSPRIGFSFPVTDRTVFHAQWGKFVQQSRLRDIYMGELQTQNIIRAEYAYSQPMGWDIRPERTTQYELGFSQQITDFASFDLTAFYKDILDQTQIGFTYRAPTAVHKSYWTWFNGDFATTKGLEVKVTLRRVKRVQAQVNYTLSDARGTGSNSSTSFVTIWQGTASEGTWLPVYAQPLDFDQTHRGSISLDYRFGKDDGGPILERLGANFLLTFNSGHPYTAIVMEGSYGNTRIPKEPVNTSNLPWNFQIDMKLDKSFTVAGVDLDAYIWVINLLDTKNVTGVYQQTGAADNNGYLSTAEGQKKVSNWGQSYVDVYNVVLANAGNWGPPRQIRLGLRLDF